MSQLAFAGTVPNHYDDGLGPVIFEPYAVETASRLAAVGDQDWLELAAGTGRVTRHRADGLPIDGRLVATDLQPGMFGVAEAKIDDPRVRFEVADATALPYAAGTFDVVISQFGVMFYPDRELGHREARRVLRPGGTYLFTSWASHMDNPWAATVHELVCAQFPTNPPGFFSVPFSYANPTEMEASLQRAGFTDVQIEKVSKPLIADRAEDFARGAIAGTPLAGQITEHGADAEAMIARVAEEFTRRFGGQPMLCDMAAFVVTAR